MNKKLFERQIIKWYRKVVEKMRKNKSKQDGVWLGLIHIPQAEYEKRVEKANANHTCWICGKHLTVIETLTHKHVYA